MRAPPFLALFALGCAASVPAPEPCELITWHEDLLPDPGVDLLFVIDDSNSMLAEQVALGEGLPRLVRILATGDYDEDGDGVGDGELGDPDFEPPPSLQVGVVTTDMGTAGFVFPTCEEPVFGGDGILRATRCSAAPRFLTFSPTGGEPDAFAAEVACLVEAGTGGCGFEQPLEAALKALSPAAATSWTAAAYDPPTFFGTPGHGDFANGGLVRSRSILAIVPITDEDDCSVADPALFDRSGPYGSTDLNFLCTESEALTSIDRYVDGFLQLRRNPRMLVFAPIVGIPLGMDTSSGTSWDEILVHPDMQERVSPDNPAVLAPACDVAPDRHAKPGTRLVRVARELEARGAHASVSSICNPAYDGAIDQLIRMISSAPSRDCVAQPLAVEPDGSVRCDLDVSVDPGIACDEIPGTTPLLIDGVPAEESGRPVCRFTQLIPTDRTLGSEPPTEAGWYYDDFTGDAPCAGPDGVPRRVVHQPEIPLHATLRLSCHPSAMETRCSADEDCERFTDATCVEGVCAGWTCE